MVVGSNTTFRQAMQRAGERAAIKRQNRSTRAGDVYQMRDIPAHTGNAGHFRFALTVKLERDVICSLGGA